MSRPIGSQPMPTPPTITLASRCACGPTMRLLGISAPATGLSPWSDGADTVLAFPFVIEAPTTFYKVFWVNGSAAGNATDVGIYDASANFIVGTGAATTGSGTSVPQIVSLSATTILPPGLYYCGITHGATTTNQFTRWAAAQISHLKFLGCWKSSATDAAPLNTASLTMAALSNVAMPLYGLITRSVFDV